MQDTIATGFTRVTEVLERYSDFSNVPEHHLKNASDRGSRVHDFCDLYARNLLIEEVDEDCKPYFNAFKSWFDNYVDRVVMTEQRLNCPHYRISGKPDLVVEMQGEPVLIDLKTPQTVSKTWRLQTAAYRYLLEHFTELNIKRTLVLQLPCKLDMSVKVHEYVSYEEDFSNFLQCLQIHNFFRKSI